jgi:hypothetical protein
MKLVGRDKKRGLGLPGGSGHDSLDFTTTAMETLAQLRQNAQK